MKVVKKLILWIPLLCIAAFLVVWLGALLKNYILTVKYADVLENMVIDEPQQYMVDPRDGFDFERIMSYSETEIKTYFMEDYEIGGVITYRLNSDGTWDFHDDVTWSHSGTADDYVWPYWYHVSHIFIH